MPQPSLDWWLSTGFTRTLMPAVVLAEVLATFVASDLVSPSGLAWNSRLPEEAVRNCRRGRYPRSAASSCAAGRCKRSADGLPREHRRLSRGRSLDENRASILGLEVEPQASRVRGCYPRRQPALWNRCWRGRELASRPSVSPRSKLRSPDLAVFAIVTAGLPAGLLWADDYEASRDEHLRTRPTVDRCSRHVAGPQRPVAASR